MDWKTIQTEYITDESSSYRKLAEKYNVPFKTLADRAKREGWAKKKKQHRDKVITKTIKKKENEQIDRMTRLLTVTDKLLNKIEQTVDRLTDDEIVIEKSTLKQISGALKDIKEIQGAKTDRDIREQEARIRNLEKQAQGDDDKPNKITITIEGGEESWQQ